MEKRFMWAIFALLFSGQICNAQFAGGSSILQTPKYTQRTTQGNYISGYKGFGEIGCAIGSNDYAGFMASASFYTSHGYQFAPYVFVGGGIGFEAGTYLYLPIFAECRVNLLNPNTRKIAPYIGTRVGYAALEDAGSAYFNFFVGIRIPLRKNALHISTGYQLTGIDVYYYYNYYYYGGWYSSGYFESTNGHSLSLRLGYEF